MDLNAVGIDITARAGLCQRLQYRIGQDAVAELAIFLRGTTCGGKDAVAGRAADALKRALAACILILTCSEDRGRISVLAGVDEQRLLAHLHLADPVLPLLAGHPFGGDVAAVAKVRTKGDVIVALAVRHAVAGKQDDEPILLLEVEGCEIFERARDILLLGLVLGKQDRLRNVIAPGLGDRGKSRGKLGDVGDGEPQRLELWPSIGVDANADDVQARRALVGGENLALAHLDAVGPGGEEILAVIGGGQ